MLVSAAANATGAMAGQIAMLKGGRAIGIAGTREKCDWVTRHARLSSCINHARDNLAAIHEYKGDPVGNPQNLQ